MSTASSAAIAATPLRYDPCRARDRHMNERLTSDSRGRSPRNREYFEGRFCVKCYAQVHAACQQEGCLICYQSQSIQEWCQITAHANTQILNCTTSRKRNFISYRTAYPFNQMPFWLFRNSVTEESPDIFEFGKTSGQLPHPEKDCYPSRLILKVSHYCASRYDIY